MKRYRHNLAHLELVADALSNLLEEVTFVGGSTTILMVDEAAFGGVRQTEDVDVIIDVATKLDYWEFSKKLRKSGFSEDAESETICRWKIKRGDTQMKLDVMPDSEEILGFSNRWYKDSIDNADAKTLPSGIQIQVVSPAYFLATKFEAFLGRGNGDYAASHDLEDIVFVLENRSGLMKELFVSPDNLKQYLGEQAAQLLNDDFLNVLPSLAPSAGGVDAVVGYLKLMSGWQNN